MRKAAVMMLALLLLAEAVLVVCAEMRKSSMSRAIGSALEEKAELMSEIEEEKKTAAGLREELAELEESNAWAKEMYDIWMREDREIKEIIGS